MIIECFRCGKELDSPDASNADYIMAADTMAREVREVLVALKHNAATLAKEALGLPIDGSEYDAVEIPNLESSGSIEGLVRVVAEFREQDIQKTGVICPDCYKDTDFVIWGVHKELL